jgi:iron complex transport system permease protein
VTADDQPRQAPQAAEARRRRRAFLALLVALPIVLLLGVSLGSVPLPPAGVARSLLQAAGASLPGADPDPLSPSGETILWSVRLPRVLLAGLVGGGLAVVGAALQSLFRNPMADAGLLGVGPGAALGAVLAVNLGWAHQVFLALPLCAFGGAMAAVLAVYLLAHAGGRPSLHGLLLTGLAVSAVAGAGTSLLLVATEEFRVRTVLFWLAGGLEGRGWEHLRLGAVFILAGSAALAALARPLDVLSLGEEEAAALSLPVHATRMGVFVLASLIAGPATALAGSVPFVGLVAPHALRPLVGGVARRLLPASFLAGAVLVVVADLAARTVSDRLDLPLGSVTALVGAPYFLFALRAQEGRA